MKKLNIKKLSQFYSNKNNAPEMISLVQVSVDNYIHSDVPNPKCLAVLSDLGLLMDA